MDPSSFQPPATLAAWAVLALLAGLRHGLDADHLATIDALTRLGARPQRRLAGLMFALGHGAVLVLLVLAASLLRVAAPPPEAVGVVMAVVSALLLLALGVINLRVVLATPAGTAPPLTGLRSRWVQHLPARHAPVLMGALFALSFDVIGQATVFALAGPALGGVAAALGLAALFALGMAAVDALDGWWLSRLLARTDDLAWRAGRWLGLAVAALSLLMGTLMLLRVVWPWLDGRLDPLGGVLSAAAVAIIVASYGLARWLARRRPVLAAA